MPKMYRRPHKTLPQATCDPRASRLIPMFQNKISRNMKALCVRFTLHQITMFKRRRYKIIFGECLPCVILTSRSNLNCLDKYSGGNSLAAVARYGSYSELHRKQELKHKVISIFTYTK